MRELDFYHKAVRDIKMQMDNGRYNEIAFYQAWKYLKDMTELCERYEERIKSLEFDKRENFHMYQEAIIDKRLYRKTIENMLNGNMEEAKKHLDYIVDAANYKGKTL